MTGFVNGQKVRVIRDTESALRTRIRKGLEGVVEDSAADISLEVGVRTTDKSYYVLRIEDLEIIPSAAVVKEGDEVEISITVSGPVETVGGQTMVRQDAMFYPVLEDNLVSHTPATPVVKPGTFGTAYWAGKTRHGFLDTSGYFQYPDDSGVRHEAFPGGFSDFKPDGTETALPEHTEEVLRRVVSNTLFRMDLGDTDLTVDGHDRLVMEGMKELRDGVSGPPLMAGTASEETVDRGRLHEVLRNGLLYRGGFNAQTVPSSAELDDVVDSILEELGLE